LIIFNIIEIYNRDSNRDISREKEKLIIKRKVLRGDFEK
jgi:hypothetical protein